MSGERRLRTRGEWERRGWRLRLRVHSAAIKEARTFTSVLQLRGEAITTFLNDTEGVSMYRTWVHHVCMYFFFKKKDLIESKYIFGRTMKRKK